MGFSGAGGGGRDGMCGCGYRLEGQCGLVNERISGWDVSQRNCPPHSGHIRAGYPPGSVGGKASTMMSSIQSAWSQERQRYLAHSLG